MIPRAARAVRRRLRFWRQAVREAVGGSACRTWKWRAHGLCLIARLRESVQAFDMRKRVTALVELFVHDRAGG